MEEAVLERLSLDPTKRLVVKWEAMCGTIMSAWRGSRAPPHERSMAMKQIPTLTDIDAALAVAACQAKAKELKAAVTIAVVDAAGALLSLHRMDGAKAYTIDLATRKARTSAAVGIDTATLQKVMGASPLSSEVLAVPGGMPVLHRSGPAGAIGISGSQTETDSAVATAGIEAIGKSNGASANVA
jgi:uncharacterized protein GlcG (DUF336 family)